MEQLSFSLSLTWYVSVFVIPFFPSVLQFHHLFYFSADMDIVRFLIPRIYKKFEANPLSFSFPSSQFQFDFQFFSLSEFMSDWDIVACREVLLAAPNNIFTQNITILFRYGGYSL